jgi:hypothetical protein
MPSAGTETAYAQCLLHFKCIPAADEATQGDSPCAARASDLLVCACYALVGHGSEC